MPNIRNKNWTTTTPANVADAQWWEDHALTDGGTAGQVLTKASSTDQDAIWADPASSGHTIQNSSGTDMAYRANLQFLNADLSDDSSNDRTVVDCKGSKGDPGQAATVTVGTVTTLPAGSQATVTNSGTTSAAVFDFGIPKGADGTGAVTSVNNKTGAVVLTASDVGALPDSTVIPDAPVQSNWNETDTSNLAYIQNKPSIPTITDTYSSLSHDGMSGVAVASAVSGKADASDLDGWTSISYATTETAGKTVVFDNLNNSYAYEIFAVDTVFSVISMTIGTGTNTGTKKLTYVVEGDNVSVGVTQFKLRIYK